MTEIIVKFRDYTIPFAPCATGTVAYARCAAWLTRFPYARVEEKMGKVTSIMILVDENVPEDLRRDGDY